MFSINFAITYIVILTCVMFLNLIISLSVLWIDNDIIAYIALQKQPLLFRGYLTTKRDLFYSPFFCYHSISLYICKLIYFFHDRAKILRQRFFRRILFIHLTLEPSYSSISSSTVTNEYPSPCNSSIIRSAAFTDDSEASCSRMISFSCTLSMTRFAMTLELSVFQSSGSTSHSTSIIFVS